MPESFATYEDGQVFYAADYNPVLDAVEALAAGRYNVKRYGAVGDGTTDDWAAFQAAADALCAAGAGTLVIPAPEVYYRILDTVTVLPESPDTQVFFDVAAEGRNAAIRFEAPDQALFHTKGVKHSKISGVKVQLTAAAANSVVWEIDADATYQSTGSLLFENCLCDFLGGGQNVGWRFGKSGGGYDFSVIRFTECGVTGADPDDGDTAIYNYSINGLAWLFENIGASNIFSLYADSAPLSTLNGAIDDTVTTIAINENNDLPYKLFPTVGEVQIDSERITYTGKSGGSLTGCTRGANSTTPASHLNGATVRHYLGSAGPSGANSMTFLNPVISNTRRDFTLGVGGDLNVIGGRFENGHRFLHQISGSSPISLNISTKISDYTPSDERVFYIQHPGSVRLHTYAVRPNGSAYTAAFIYWGGSATRRALTLSGAIHASDPPYTANSAILDLDLSKCLRLSDANTVAGYFASPAPALAVATKTADYTVLAGDALIVGNGASGNITATLPAVATVPIGKRYEFKRIHASNSLIVDGSGSETIDGATTKTLGSQYAHLTVVNSGTEWNIVASGGTIT